MNVRVTGHHQRLIGIVRQLSKVGEWTFENVQQGYPTIEVKRYGQVASIGKLRLHVYHETMEDWDEDDVLPSTSDHVVKISEGRSLLMFAVARQEVPDSPFEEYPDPPLQDFRLLQYQRGSWLLQVIAASLQLSGKLHAD
jgi:hypothetical protein